jgi:hypothetical protein
MCPVYRAFLQANASFDRPFVGPATAPWSGTVAATFAQMVEPRDTRHHPPTRFKRAGASSDDGETFNVDASDAFRDVATDRSLFIRDCFDDGAAATYGGLHPMLELRQALFGESARLWQVSPAGFSRDGTHALLYAENHCGALCGIGLYYLFEKRDGRWVLAGTAVAWIS